MTRAQRMAAQYVELGCLDLVGLNVVVVIVAALLVVAVGRAELSL